MRPYLLVATSFCLCLWSGCATYASVQQEIVRDSSGLHCLERFRAACESVVRGMAAEDREQRGTAEANWTKAQFDQQLQRWNLDRQRYEKAREAANGWIDEMIAGLRGNPDRAVLDAKASRFDAKVLPAAREFLVEQSGTKGIESLAITLVGVFRSLSDFLDRHEKALRALVISDTIATLESLRWRPFEVVYHDQSPPQPLSQEQNHCTHEIPQRSGR